MNWPRRRRGKEIVFSSTVSTLGARRSGAGAGENAVVSSMLVACSAAAQSLP